MSASGSEFSVIVDQSQYRSLGIVIIFAKTEQPKSCCGSESFEEYRTAASRGRPPSLRPIPCHLPALQDSFSALAAILICSTASSACCGSDTSADDAASGPVETGGSSVGRCGCACVAALSKACCGRPVGFATRCRAVVSSSRCRTPAPTSLSCRSRSTRRRNGRPSWKP